MYTGWYQAAFEPDLQDELTPADLGPAPIVLIRTPNGIRAVDARCPHRGAHLAYGGALDAGAIVCPFHGKRIQLGTSGGGRYRVREHPVLGYGGMVFVGWGNGLDNGFAELLGKFGVSHVFLPGFTKQVAARADLVIENAFDGTHFRPVHGIGEDPSLALLPEAAGEKKTIAVQGTFLLPASPWQRSGGKYTKVPFVARAFSPHVVVSEIGGDYPYVAITAATPRPQGGCVIRFSLAIPAATHESTPRERREPLYRYLMKRSQAGIEQDLPVWEHLIDTVPDYDSADDTVIAFRRFCTEFQHSEEGVSA